MFSCFACFRNRVEPESHALHTDSGQTYLSSSIPKTFAHEQTAATEANDIKPVRFVHEDVPKLDLTMQHARQPLPVCSLRADSHDSSLNASERENFENIVFDAGSAIGASDMTLHEIQELRSEQCALVERLGMIDNKLKSYEQSSVEDQMRMSKHVRSLAFEKRVLKHRVKKIESSVIDHHRGILSKSGTPSLLSRAAFGSPSVISLSLLSADKTPNDLFVKRSSLHNNSKNNVLYTKSLSSSQSPLSVMRLTNQSPSEELARLCTVCLHVSSEPLVTLECGHACHESCSKQHLPLEPGNQKHRQEQACPLCRRKVHPLSVHTQYRKLGAGSRSEYSI